MWPASEYQPNLCINVITATRNSVRTYFHELGRTREEIIAEHAPELLPWLLSYAIRLDGDPTVEEMVARYERNLATLHKSRLLDPHYGGANAVVEFELHR